MRKAVRQIQPGVILYRDDLNGLAWIEDGRTGLGVSVHPNISNTGSVRGMIDRGYWDKKERTIRSHGWIYNIDRFVCDKDDELEMIVADECNCSACIERRERNAAESK